MKGAEKILYSYQAMILPHWGIQPMVDKAVYLLAQTLPLKLMGGFMI
jgi:hypothetical protein